MASASNPSAAAARAALTMPVETTAPRGPHGLDPGSSLEPPRPLRDSDPCIPAAGGGRKHTAVSATLRYRIRSIRNTTGRLIPYVNSTSTAPTTTASPQEAVGSRAGGRGASRSILPAEAADVDRGRMADPVTFRIDEARQRVPQHIDELQHRLITRNDARPLADGLLVRTHAELTQARAEILDIKGDSRPSARGGGHTLGRSKPRRRPTPATRSVFT